jgi:putative effector of murein hydrolase LrgA (UPF0299 family)
MAVAIDWMQTFFAIKVVGGVVGTVLVFGFLIYAISQSERFDK